MSFSVFTAQTMKYHDSVLGLIGNTPLIRLNRLNKGLKPTILAKMENLNPGFSVKDRIGISMIEAAERDDYATARRWQARINAHPPPAPLLPSKV